MKHEVSFWQAVFYVSWAVFGLWLVLKLTGVIQTPFWLEYGVPLTSLFVGIMGLHQNLVEQIHKVAVALAALAVKVEHVDRDVEGLKDDAGILKTDVGVLKQRTAHL